jgi:signal transduction histidine kinase
VIGLRRALQVIAAAALALGAADVPVVLSSHHETARGALLAATLVIGWSFVGTGIYAWWRRPANRIGSLMTLTGFFWLLLGLSAANAPGVFLAGYALAPLSYGFLIHLLVCFPDGRLETRLERVVVAIGYLAVTLAQVPTVLFADTTDTSICDGCPANPILIKGADSLYGPSIAIQGAFAIAALVGLLVALVQRWRRWPPLTRRAYAPVLWLGGTMLALTAVRVGAGAAGAGNGVEVVLFVVALFPLAAIPFAFLLGLLRSRMSRADAVTELMGALAEPGLTREGLAAALSEALGDPELRLAFWVPDRDGYVDAEGRPVSLPSGEGAWTPVEHDGRPVGAIVHGVALDDGGEMARAVAAAAGLSLENARLEAELRARLLELQASRARIVEAGDAERRRVERNLHDGAQQRLMSLALSLRLARSKLDTAPDEVAGLLEQASAELDTATDELRELARGIHPAILTDRGLQPALEALAGRAPVRVELRAELEARPPASVEAAAYYVVAEALANVGRHSGADEAVVTLAGDNGELVVEVVDRGAGGADPAGSGLRGLADRGGAVDGRLEVLAGEGAGTIVRATIPLGAAGH